VDEVIAAIEACAHTRVEVVDQDEVWSPEGTTVVGLNEMLWCPDCPLGGEWVPAGTAAKILAGPS
jgi:hypothetical protein